MRLVLVKVRLLGHKQRICVSTCGYGHGTKNGQKGNGDAFGLKVGRMPDEGRVRNKRCENARVLESS